MAHTAHAKAVMETEKRNLYMLMPLDRVKADAAHGVFLAMQALRRRDLAGALAIGLGVEPAEQKENHATA